MNLREHKKHFNKRWNIISNESYEEAFKKFKQRILNIFQNIDGITIGDRIVQGISSIDDIISENSILKFCQYYSIPAPKKSDNKYLRNNILTDHLKKEDNKIEFLRLIEVILSLKFFFEEPNNFRYYDEEEDPHGDGEERISLLSQMYERMKRDIKETIEISDINVAVGKNSEGQIILYPKGEKKLDKELINKTLSFLNDKSNKHFEEALKLYQNKQAVKSAESLRRSLEEFLKDQLQNQRGLEKNIDTLQKELKNDSKPEVRNIIFQTFNYLDKYFNENSKHGDGNISESENEFLIYQTGLLSRYINKINLKNQRSK